MSLFTIVIAIVVWGLVVKLIIKTEPKNSASLFSKITWLLFWFFTLSFFFGSSSSSSSGYTTNNYGGDYYNEDENCTDTDDYDFSFWNNDDSDSWSGSDDWDGDDDGD